MYFSVDLTKLNTYFSKVRKIDFGALKSLFLTVFLFLSKGIKKGKGGK
jgi:hypothetical protein